MLKLFNDTRAGKTVDTDMLRHALNDHHGPLAQQARMCMAMQIELMAGRRNLFTVALQELNLDPMIRPYWVMFDSYAQQLPTDNVYGFYIVLQHMYPNDPWVKKACGRYFENAHQRSPAPTAAVLQQLCDFPPTDFDDPSMIGSKIARDLILNQSMTWIAAQVIYEDIDSGHRDQALEVARRLQNLSLMAGFPGVRIWAHRLVTAALADPVSLIPPAIDVR